VLEAEDSTRARTIGVSPPCWLAPLLAVPLDALLACGSSFGRLATSKSVTTTVSG